MLTARDNRAVNLAEGWPDDEANFELEAFAHRLRAARPELSGPALDRIAGRVQEEVDRRTPRDPSQTLAARCSMRIAGTARRARPHLVRLAPYAVAALVMIGVGLWLGLRGGDKAAVDSNSAAQTPAAEHVRPQLPGKTVHDRLPMHPLPPAPLVEPGMQMPQGPVLPLDRYPGLVGPPATQQQ